MLHKKGDTVQEKETVNEDFDKISSVNFEDNNMNEKDNEKKITRSMNKDLIKDMELYNASIFLLIFENSEC